MSTGLYTQRRRSSAASKQRAFLSSVIVLGFVAAGSTAAAAVYQVGPSRSHSNLQSVADLLQPGDVVEVDGDATYSGGVQLDRQGLPSAKITIRGVLVNGKRPVISGGTNTIEAAGNHYVFEGLELTGGSSRCFFHHADDITIRNSVIHDCPQHGVLGADDDSGSLTIEHSEVYSCGSGDGKHQIYMATDESAYPGSVFRMDHCFIHDGNGGNNVKTRAERNEIRYNWIEGAYYHELELIGPDGQDPSLAIENSDVVGNVLVKRNSFYVIRIGGDGTGDTDGRYRFMNNTIVVRPGGSAVFRVFDGIDAVEMNNNVFAAIGGGSVDIMRDSDASWVSGRMVAGSNNWVMQGSSVPNEWTGTITGSDPGFISLDTYDLRLSASSALVDAGLENAPGCPGHPFPDPLALPAYVPSILTVAVDNTGLDRPQVGALDIGAFEYGTGSPGTGGSAGTGGTGGSAGTGGTGGSAGTGGTDPGTAGAAGTGGGTSGTGGDPGTSGAGGSAGSPGDAGSGGAAGSAGSVADPGAASGGGSSDVGTGATGPGKADLGGAADDPSQDPSDPDDSEPGIGCGVSQGSHGGSGWLLTALVALAAAVGVRRRNG